MDNSLYTFRIILSDCNCTLPLLISFLQANDLENLVRSCRPITLDNQSIQLILNSIHFFRYILFDHSLNMMWGYNERQSFVKQGANVQTILNLQQVRYGRLNTKINYATEALLSELAKVVTGTQAITIVSDILETLREGPMAVPHLRGKNIGMHANSPVQYYYCDILTMQDTQIEDDYVYDTLREYIYDNQELLTQTARNPKTNLKNMRFLSDSTICYNKTPCLLINLINLLLTICDTHIQGIYQYIKSICSIYERMIYFVSYYNNFRKSVISLNEKLGFLFNELHFTFEEIYPEWKGLPIYSLVTILLKKWFNKMEQFQDQFNNLFSLLLIKYRQSKLINGQQNGDMFSKAVFNGNFVCKSMTATTYSCILERKLQFKADGFMQIMNHNSDALRYLTHYYRQYLVDLSVNEFSVHMNGHSQQEIGRVYRQAEATIMADTLSFHKHLFAQIQNFPAIKLLIEGDIQILKDIIKPITLKKIINNANNCLNEWKQNLMVPEDQHQTSILQAFLSEQSEVTFPFSKQDCRIESIMENFRIPRELPQETSKLYDLTCVPDIRELERMFDYCESVIDLEELECYQSEEERVDEEFEPRLLNKQSSITVQKEEIPNQKPNYMDIELEFLKMEKSVESTREAETVSLEGDIEVEKRQIQYQMDCQEKFFNLKRFNESTKT